MPSKKKNVTGKSNESTSSINRYNLFDAIADSDTEIKDNDINTDGDNNNINNNTEVVENDDGFKTFDRRVRKPKQDATRSERMSFSDKQENVTPSVKRSTKFKDIKVSENIVDNNPENNVSTEINKDKTNIYVPPVSVSDN